MTHLEKIAQRVGELHGRIRLRPTLDAAREIGELLGQARGLVRHGEWKGWIKDNCPGISYRTAAVYMQVAAHPEKVQRTAQITIADFLAHLRAGRKAQVRAEREQLREEMAEKGRTARTPRAAKLVCADCRKYDWPEVVDVVTTDPPWDDLDCYRWLGKFCSNQLRPGGLALVQCGVSYLPVVLDSLRQTLNYVHTAAIVYDQCHRGAPNGMWVGCWRPVLVFSRGQPDRSRLAVVSDTRTVPPSPPEYHDWQQPLAPWAMWLSALTRPGELVADPYAGSGTTGLAVLQAGDGRRWIGTELDRTRYRIARARLGASVS